MLRNIVLSYVEELLAPHPIPQLEYHSLSAVCDCLFNIFAAVLHNRDRSSISNLMARLTVLAGTKLSRLSWDRFLTDKTILVDRWIIVSCFYGQRISKSPVLDIFKYWYLYTLFASKISRPFIHHVYFGVSFFYVHTRNRNGGKYKIYLHVSVELTHLRRKFYISVNKNSSHELH